MGLIDRMGRTIGDTVRAFRAELGRREPEDAVAELLSAMRSELAAAREGVHASEEALERARASARDEERALEDCRRRGGMARRIEDTETVRVAAEFEARHERELERLREEVLERELDVQAAREEAERMADAYRRADGERHALVAVLRREGWHGALEGEAEGAFELYRKIRGRGETEAVRKQRAEERLERLKREMES